MADALPDQDSEIWMRELDERAPTRETAVARLHEMLLRVTRAEAARRRSNMPERAWEELDDLCREAASDAVLAVLRKLRDFRGEARFTTWAFKFAILEISTRLRRHAWRQRQIESDERVWDRLADSTPSMLGHLQWAETMELIRRAVREQLSERQRMVFEAAVLREVPIDVLADQLGSTRGAVYKVLHDARTKLRSALAQAEKERS
ncbi:MAG TPA: sigma-70 family RNA polymerase sigma factor [Gemmatimonadaceae bacterium]